jgi:predicted peptidase
MKIKLSLIVIIVAFSLTATIFFLTAHADFLKGIQYMVPQGIAQVPISQVTATNNVPSDNDRVTSIVVHFENIQNAPSGMSQEITINSFQRLVGSSQTIQNYRITQHFANTGPQFQLIDLPSKDKAQFYQLVAASIQLLELTNNNNYETNPFFDVYIDLITGDGTLLYTLQYDQCQISAYYAYDDGNKQDYRMASEDQSEYREVTDFVCQGYHLDLPSNGIGSNTYSP